jgi:hypothetical protein
MSNRALVNEYGQPVVSGRGSLIDSGWATRQALTLLKDKLTMGRLVPPVLYDWTGRVIDKVESGCLIGSTLTLRKPNRYNFDIPRGLDEQ